MTEFALLKQNREFTKFTRNARNWMQEKNPREKSVICIFLVLRPLYVNEFFVVVIQFSFPLRVHVGELYNLICFYYHMENAARAPRLSYIFYIAKYGTVILIVCQNFLYIFLPFIDRDNSRVVLLFGEIRFFYARIKIERREYPAVVFHAISSMRSKKINKQEDKYACINILEIELYFEE